jgi:hypothetical protein
MVVSGMAMIAQKVDCPQQTSRFGLQKSDETVIGTVTTSSSFEPPAGWSSSCGLAVSTSEPLKSFGTLSE